MTTHHINPRATKGHDVHVKIPTDLLDQLDNYCTWHKTSRTLTVCDALQQLLIQEQPRPASWHP